MSRSILIATEYYSPHWTGIAKAIAALASQLAEKNHSVTILTTRFDNSLSQKEVKDGVVIFRVPFAFKLSRTHYSPQTLVVFLRLIGSHDAIVINSPHSNIFFLSLITKIFGKRLIIFHQGDLILPKKSGKTFINKLIEIVFDLLSFPSFFLADTISTYTEDYARHSRIMKFFLKKFVAYIPPIKKPIGTPSATIKSKFENVAKTHVLIGFAGRFVEEKGFDILLQAIPLVLKQIPNALFIFAGQTKMPYEHFFEQNKKLLEKNKKTILILGLLNEGDLAFFYHFLTIFVVSSRSDCFPLTQIEAFKSNVPVVVTDIPGARIAVKQTGYGVIVRPNDVDDLARGIITGINTRNLLKDSKKNIAPFFNTYHEAIINYI